MDTTIISKLEMKAHLLLGNCVDSGSQVMQCNKTRSVIGYCCCARPQRWLLKPKRTLGLSNLYGVTKQNRYQCYIFRSRIMLQAYNSSLYRPSSWFVVEKSRSHPHSSLGGVPVSDSRRNAQDIVSTIVMKPASCHNCKLLDSHMNIQRTLMWSLKWYTF